MATACSKVERDSGKTAEVGEQHAEFVGGHKVFRLDHECSLVIDDGFGFGDLFGRPVHFGGHGADFSQAMQGKRSDRLIGAGSGKLFLGVGQVHPLGLKRRDVFEGRIFQHRRVVRIDEHAKIQVGL